MVAVMAAVLGAVAACVPLGGRSVTVESSGAATDGDVGGPPWATTTTRPRASGPHRAAHSASTTTTTTSTTVPGSAPSSVASASIRDETPTIESAAPLGPQGDAPPGSAPGPDRSSRLVTAEGVALLRELQLNETLVGLSSQSSRDVASAAIRQVRFDWIARLPGWTVRFRDSRAGHRGLTFIDRRLIEVYVRSNDTPESLAHVVAHELGHAVDLTYFDDGHRAVWLAARGRSADTIWFPGESGVSDFNTGAGDFAESFAWVVAPPAQWSGQLGPPPDVVQAGVLMLLVGTG